MKTCPNCLTENPDENAFCSRCGAPMNGQPAYQPPAAPKVNPWDHTKEFEEEDIAHTKLYAMCSYLLGLPGILLALLADRNSAYNRFHIHQALKLTILDALTCLISGILVWTVVVPAAGAAAIAVLIVLRILAFFDVCRNKAMEPWLVRSLKFLR